MKRRKPENIAQQDWDAVESPPLTDALLSSMKPARKVHPDMPPRVRGPQKAPRKTPVFVRLDAAVIDAFRATGRGWQTKMNAALKEWLMEHKAA